MISGAAAIAGIGATEFSKDSGRSELRLAVEAVRAALDDAGLHPSDVDGLVTFTMDDNAETAVAREIGAGELTFLSRIGYGGGAAARSCSRRCSPSRPAWPGRWSATARSTNGPAAGSDRSHGGGGAPRVDAGWHYPMGLATPAAMVAMVARRYLHDYGATTDDFGRVAVAARRHAATNPARVVLRAADHPGRAPGVALDRRAAAAARLLPGERRRGRAGGDLGVPGPGPAPAAGRDPRRGAGERARPVHDDQLLPRRHGGAAGDGRGRAAAVGASPGLRPGDMRTAVLYDHFTPYVLMQLEELGFCGRGEARPLIADPGAVADQPERRAAGGGLHPRHERHRRGRPADPWHRRQPDRRRRPGPGHGRHRRPDQRPDGRPAPVMP